MRAIVSSAVALALGAVGGLAAMHAKLQPQLDAVVLEAQALQQQLKSVPDMSAEKARLERLEEENARNLERLSNLNREMDEMRLAYDFLQAQTGMDEDDLAGLPDMDMAEGFAFGQQAAAAMARGWPRGGEDASENEDGREARDGRSREEVREEWAARRRERRDELLNEALARVDDPLMQERILAVGEYMDYFTEMRQEMSNAQTDEERQAVRDAMRASMGDLQQMMRDHQNDLLHSVAGQYGLDSQQQQAIVRELRETMRDPIYSLQPQRGGRGGGGPPAGWGRGAPPGGGWGGRGGGGGGDSGGSN